MAIQYLHNINLNDNELQNAKLHVTDSAPTAATGQIYFHSTSGTIRVHNGSGWQTLSTDQTDDFITYSTSVVSSSGIKLRLTGTPVSGSTTTDDVKFTGSQGITISRADASTINIQGTTYTSSSFNHDDLTGFVANEHIDWTTDQGSTNIHAGNYSNTQLSNSEVVAAIVASTGISGSDKSTFRSNIGAGTSSFDGAYSSLSGIPSTFAPSSHNHNDIYYTETEIDNMVVKLTGNQSIAGDKTFSDNVTVSGNLTVTGTTTTNNVEVVSTSNGVVFEGNAADANEGTLLAGTLSADRTYTLPNKSGTVAMTSDITGTNSGTNTGDEPDASTTVKGVVELATNTEANAGSATNRALTPANLGAFTGQSNIVTVGTITSGTWQGSTISTSYIQNLSGTNTGDEPDATTSTKGIIEIATDSEVKTGTSTNKAVTPAGLRVPFKAVTITGDGSATSFNVDHNFALSDLIDVNVQVVDSLSSSGTYGQTVMAGVDRTTANRVVVSFGSAPASGQTYKVHCIQMGV